MEEVGRQLGEREAAHVESLAGARRMAEQLHGVVVGAIDAFHAAAAQAGSPHLAIEMDSPRLDDKHVRSVEFGLRRGRHRAIVTVKAKGEVTFVGPFRQGKTEGPCQTFPFDADQEIARSLGDFLAGFLEEAATP